MTSPEYSPAHALADLEWVMRSPFLIAPRPATSSIEAAEPVISPLETAAIDSAELTRFLQERHSHRVGYYFENLIDFWLRHSDEAAHVERQIRIADAERTIGELDFAFRNSTGQLCHWEAAVKFYLYSPRPNPAGSHWLGPNARDYLEKKWNRLRTHQLPLAARHFGEPVSSMPFVKGVLFQPLLGDTENSPLLGETENSPIIGHPPEFTAPEHQTGFWIHYRDLQRLPEHWQTRRFQELNKPFWFTVGNSPDGEHRRESPDYLAEHLQSQPELTTHPRYFATFTQQNSKWSESERLFVVPDDWPYSGAQ